MPPRPERSRVRKHAEYQVIQAQGRRVNTAHFVLVLRVSGEPQAAARVGITASRKIGGAVVRNRAKRVVREAFRRSTDLWAPDIDVVVIVRRSLGPMKLDHVLSEWNGVRALVARRSDQARSDQLARAAAAKPEPT